MKKAIASGLAAAVASLVFFSSPSSGQMAKTDSLEEGFAAPPMEARPRVYWWWLNSIATKESITRDLEELKDKGYGGAMIFDAGGPAGPMPMGPVFGGKEWTALLLHALKEADRLGLEISLNILSGWNTGGPSVKPDDAMKRLVTSTKRVKGPAKFEALLPQPAGKNYHDVLVQACKLLGGGGEDIPASQITASSSQAEYPPGGILTRTQQWVSQDAPSATAPQWLQITYPEPVEASVFHVSGRKGYGPREFQFQYSEDGKKFVSAGRFSFSKDRFDGEFKITPVKATAFRLVVTSSFTKLNVQVTAFGIGPAQDAAAGRLPIKDWNYKTFNSREYGGYNEDNRMLREDYPAQPGEADFGAADVIDLTAKMDKSGRLTWDVPAGDWLVIRYGWAMLGSHVSTCHPQWNGLVLDHLDEKAVRGYLNEAIEPLLKAAGPLVGRSLKYLYSDSWESGVPNWTRDFMEQFKSRRGYDPAPYLPVMAGRIVTSREVSNRFLYDLRKTVGDCIADRYYGTFDRYAHEHNLGIHCEAGGPHGHPIDALKTHGRCDWMQGEFWPRSNTHRVTEEQRYFIKQAASAAHIYGKPWIAGEGPTIIGSHWERPPRDLKDAFDYVFCEGLTRLFWHEFASSPREFGKPGLEYFAGEHFNPNATTWEQGKAFIQYIARCCYMLSRGKFVADAAVYYGDDVPVFAARNHAVPGLEGYGYDYCNAEVILTRMAAKDGRIVLPDGMSYRLLMLPDREAITLEVLQKIRQLVQDGATIVGPRPSKATGLTGYPQSDEQVRKIADEMWGPCDGKAVFENRLGKGRVVWGKSPREILAGDGVGPDVSFAASQEQSQFDFIHQAQGDADIYFVINRLQRHGIFDAKYRYFADLPDRYEQVDCSFRVSGKAPELWDPMTGKTVELATFRQQDGRTIVPLRLAPFGSTFLVFRKPAAGVSDIVSEIRRDGTSLFPVSPHKPAEWPSASVYRQDGRVVLESAAAGLYELKSAAGKSASVRVTPAAPLPIEGAWQVSFAPGWGAPASVEFPKLISWTDSSIDGIKYFSGAATYRKEFNLPEGLLKGKRLYLDLGNVLEMARVRLNGTDLGVVWTAPYRLDIMQAAKAGPNKLEIEVVNMWPNRLIGDQSLPEAQRFTRTNVTKFKKGSPLRPSGLLGPVQIVPAERIEIEFQ